MQRATKNQGLELRASIPIIAVNQCRRGLDHSLNQTDVVALQKYPAKGSTTLIALSLIDRDGIVDHNVHKLVKAPDLALDAGGRLFVEPDLDRDGLLQEPKDRILSKQSARIISNSTARLLPYDRRDHDFLLARHDGGDEESERERM